MNPPAVPSLSALAALAALPAEALFDAELDALIDRFGAGWQKLAGARIFMTGGTGWFGRWLLPALARADARLGLGLEVVALTRAPERFAALEPGLAGHRAIRFHRGDVRDFAFPDGPFTHLVHAAATNAEATFRREEDALTKFDTSLGGARRALDFAAARGIPRLLMVSSGAFYGPLRAGDRCFAEDHPVAPDPANLEVSVGHAKRAAEFVAAAYAERHGLSISTARCFSFVGPKLPLGLHYAIGNFIRDALWQDRITVGGDGTPVRSYLHAGDLIVWLLTLLTDGAPGRAYNVGSDEPVTIGELARLVGRVLAPEKPVTVLGTASGVPTRNIYLPDVSRAHGELGLARWTPLERSVLLTAAHALQTAN